MIKFEIKSRWSGAVQFTAEIECNEDDAVGVKIGLAVKWAIKSRADLYGVDLYGADLSGADLYGANLYGANLSRADLSRADLSRAKNAELAIAKTRILPDGDLIGWKKCEDGIIVKLRIPEAAKRSHAFGRKCRAEYADVVEIIGADKAISSHDGKTEYVAGQRVTPDGFDNNWQDECSRGIHFFITRLEAENYA